MLCFTQSKPVSPSVFVHIYFIGNPEKTHVDYANDAFVWVRSFMHGCGRSRGSIGIHQFWSIEAVTYGHQKYIDIRYGNILCDIS